MEIKNKINNKNDGEATKIEILSGKKIDLNELDLTFKNDLTANVSWDSKLKSDEKIPFTFSFFDENKNLVRGILFAYGISNSSGKEIWSNIGNSEKYLGILAPYGIYQESIMISNDDSHELKIILTGRDSFNFEEFFVSKSNFSLNSQSMDEGKTALIPSWIKNNAGWWSDRIIGDEEFIQSIQFLIHENIITIPVTESTSTESQEIPSWIKNNAGWWSDDLISEGDFVKGIEFLIGQGIIR